MAEKTRLKKCWIWNKTVEDFIRRKIHGTELNGCGKKFESRLCSQSATPVVWGGRLAQSERESFWHINLPAIPVGRFPNVRRKQVWPAVVHPCDCGGRRSNRKCQQMAAVRELLTWECQAQFGFIELYSPPRLKFTKRQLRISQERGGARGGENCG